MYKYLNDNVDNVIIYIYKYITGLVFVIKHEKLVAFAPLCTADMLVFELHGMNRTGSNNDTK